MYREILFSVLLLTTFHLLAGQSKKTSFINPTGTYIYNDRTVAKDGETYYGSSVEILVKLVDKSKIIMSLYIQKGTPSYSSGYFLDTLDYSNNMAVHTTMIHHAE